MFVILYHNTKQLSRPPFKGGLELYMEGVGYAFFKTFCL